MGKILKQRIKQKRFESAAQEVILNALITSDYLSKLLVEACENFGISQPQYNVLRILRGAYPEGYARYDIVDRMLERAPDVTRLLDRLSRLKLIVRGKSTIDSRLSIATITPKGLALLERMEPAIQRIYRHVEKKLTAADRKTFSKLCEKLYGDE